MLMGLSIAVLTLLCPLVIVLERSGYASSVTTEKVKNYQLLLDGKKEHEHL